MPLTSAALNIAADAVGDVISHIGLVNGSGTELTGGSYARQAVTWTAADDGDIAPTADISIPVPGSTTVGGWRAYSAASDGTDYGGGDFDPETFANAGTFVLLAAQTAINFG